MSPDKVRALQALSPRLFREVARGGISCGDGWFEILRRFAEALEQSTPLDQALPQVVQIKQKFGDMRIYVVNPSVDGRPQDPEIVETVHTMIQELEEMSHTICETCGRPGELRTDIGWWRVSCDACAKRGR